MPVDPASLHIVHYPDPVLRAETQPVDPDDANVRDVAARMIELMHEADGVGLAAPQVGLSWRMFVTNGRDVDPHDRVFMNPEMELAKDGLVAAEEGCLSLPNLHVHVRRPEEARIRAFDLEGNEFTMEGEGMLARIWQHEFDHLEGVLIIDRMSPMDRLATRRTLKDLRAASS